MITRKAIYAIIAGLVYSILIALYFELPKDIFSESEENKKCNGASPCVRFCVENFRLNEKLFRQFNATFLSSSDGFNNTIDLDNSDDDKVKIEKKNKKVTKNDKKKVIEDENIDQETIIKDYEYSDFNKEQKMKGSSKTKREATEIDYEDEEEEEIVDENLVEEATMPAEVDESTIENNSTEIFEDEEVKKVRKFKILRGSFECADKDREILDSFADMKYNITLGGEFTNSTPPHVSFTPNEYCLQEIVPPIKKNQKTPPKWKWKLKLCHNSEMDPKLYRYVAYLTTSLIIGIVFLLYNGYPDLKDTRGKCLIYLLESHLAVFALLIVIRVAEAFMYGIYELIVAYFTLFVFFCWLLFFTFIGVHNLWRLMNFSRMREDEDIFVVYASMIGFIAFCTPTTIISLQYFKYADTYNFEAFVEEASYILYMSLAFIGALFIVLSVIFIFRVSEVLKKYHQKKYATEVEWFWMFGALFVVMLVEWPFLKISFEIEDTSNLIPAVFVDLIILFSGMNFFAIFAVREKTRKATAASEF